MSEILPSSPRTQIHTQNSQPQQHEQPEEDTGGYAVELYFDPALENQVLKAWNVLARRQISSRLISISSRPHITLFSIPKPSSLDPSKLLPSLRSLEGPIPITLSSVAAFPGRTHLFLAPVPTAGLLSLHAQLCDAMRREGVDVGEDYRVDAWVPAVPVAEDVPRGRMAEAFAILKDLKLPVSGYAVDVGLVEFSPVREVFSFPLGGNGAADA